MPDQGYLSIDYLDVGQGDGTFIVTPTFDTILIDLGSKKNADVAGGDAITYLKNTLLFIQQQKSLPNPTIDILFLTHGDLDHYNLIKTLREQFPFSNPLKFNRVYVGGLKSEYTDLVGFLTSQQLQGGFSELENCEHDAMDSPSFAFQSFLWGNVYLWILSSNVPNKTKTGSGAKNQKSIVLMLRYADRKFIFTGDAESEMETRVMEWYGASPSFLECDILKLGHHGSQAGTTNAWLDALRPWAVVASSDQKWAHPYCVTLQRVIDSGSMAEDLGDHPWLCGQGANASKQYYNHFGPPQGLYGIFTTIAYQKFLERDMTPLELLVMAALNLEYDPDKVLEDGLVQGAQYQVRVEPDGEISIYSTLYHEKPVQILKTKKKKP